MAEEEVVKLLAAVTGFGFVLGVMFCLAVSLGWHLVRLVQGWWKIRKVEKELKAAGTFEVPEVEPLEDFLDGEPAARRRVDPRIRSYEVGSIAGRLGMSPGQALRVHDASLVRDPDEHDECPICALGGSRVGD